MLYLKKLTKEQQKKLCEILSEKTNSEITIKMRTSFFMDGNETLNEKYFAELYSDGKYLGFVGEHLEKNYMTEFNIKFKDDIDAKLTKKIDHGILSYMISTYGNEFKDDYIKSFNERIHKAGTELSSNEDVLKNLKSKIKEIKDVYKDEIQNKKIDAEMEL